MSSEGKHAGQSSKFFAKKYGAAARGTELTRHSDQRINFFRFWTTFDIEVSWFFSMFILVFLLDYLSLSCSFYGCILIVLFCFLVFFCLFYSLFMMFLQILLSLIHSSLFPNACKIYKILCFTKRENNKYKKCRINRIRHMFNE